MQFVPFRQTLKKRKSTRARDCWRDEACYFQITQRNKRSLDDPCQPEKQSVRKSERPPSSVTFTLSGRIKISALAAKNLALKKNVFLLPGVTWKHMLSAENTTRTRPLLKAVAEQKVKCKRASQIQREQRWAEIRQPGGGESWTQDEGGSRRRRRRG